jgi:Replication initiator protein A
MLLFFFCFWGEKNAMKKAPFVQLPLPLSPDTSEGQIGKDEMNLAEFPFAVLSRRVVEGQKTIEVIQEGRDTQGRIVQQEWLVTGSDRFGLPVAADDEVYVALMKLLRDSQFSSRTVRFSVAQLLRIMRSSTGKRDYERIEQSLDRLTGVLIRSKNAFWNHASKRHVTEAFHLLDSYRLTRGVAACELSEVTFSEFLFSSIQTGYVKNLDIDFYFSLSSPLARRYYRLLDKHRYRSRHYEIELQRLAQKLPLQDPYVSQLCRRLDPVHAEFVQCGFLEAAEYRTAPGGETVVRLQFAARSVSARLEPDDRAEDTEDTEGTEESLSPIPSALLPEENAGGLEAQMVAAGISRLVATELARAYPAEDIARQLEYLSHVPDVKNPGGYLRQAIEQGYGPPPGWVAAQQKSERAKRIRTPQKEDTAAVRLPPILEAAAVRLQSDPAAWAQVMEEARQRLPKILRDRPQNPAYQPTLQTCIAAVMAERARRETEM